MKKITILFFSVLIISISNAQQINLVKNITIGSSYSNPQILAALPNHDILFAADDGMNGKQLWRSDGTANGTFMVKHISANAFDGIQNVKSVYAGEKLFFIGYTVATGYELWVSDGTSSGTNMIKDIRVGSASGMNRDDMQSMIYFNGKLFFSARGTQGYELWCSDGTNSGTYQVKNINDGNLDSSPRMFNVINGKLYFIAGSFNHGFELWTTDGTESGTNMVSDLDPGADRGVDFLGITVYNNKLFFCGKENDSLAYELYSTDGNNIGLIKNINTSLSRSSHPHHFMEANNLLFFSADAQGPGIELWRTDGTAAGTFMLKDINPGSWDSNPFPIGAVNGGLIFSADDGIHGRELWISDGTTFGTKLLKDIQVGADDGVVQIMSEDYIDKKMVVLKNSHNGVVYFAADNGIHGRELWRTDGTETGTKMVQDLANTPSAATTSWLDYIFVDTNNVWLSISDGILGRELYLYKAPIPMFISPIFENNGLSIFPNPSNGSFTIDLQKETDGGVVILRDMKGSVIKRMICLPKTKLLFEASEVPDGVYVIEVITKKEVYKTKVGIYN